MLKLNYLIFGLIDQVIDVTRDCTNIINTLTILDFVNVSVTVTDLAEFLKGLERKIKLSSNITTNYGSVYYDE